MKRPNNDMFKQEDDLKTIIYSLHCACTLKYNSKSMDFNKKELIFKIVDFCHVTPNKALEYLNILESRRKITIDFERIYYSVEEIPLNKIEFDKL